MRYHLATLMVLCFLFSGCEKVLDFEATHAPQIHLETIIYAHEPLPDITLKRSFALAGNDPYTVDKEEILISGADVTLLWNDQIVATDEVTLGVYRPQNRDTVHMGDKVEVMVLYEGKKVTASASIPEYPTSEISISADISEFVLAAQEVLYRRGNDMDSLRVWAAESVNTRVALPYIPDYLALSVYDAFLMDYEWRGISSDPFFMPYFASDFSGLENPELIQSSFFFVLSESLPSGLYTVHCAVEMVIPEPFYVDYYNITPDFITPVTVTNVTNGVGIFIGAIRERVVLPLTIQIDFAVE